MLKCLFRFGIKICQDLELISSYGPEVGTLTLRIKNKDNHYSFDIFNNFLYAVHVPRWRGKGVELVD